MIPTEPQIKALVDVAMGRVAKWGGSSWHKPGEIHVNTLRGLLKNGLIELAVPDRDGAQVASLTEAGKAAVTAWNEKHNNSPITGVLG